MDREFVGKIALSLLSLSRSVERCRQVLSDPDASTEERSVAETTLLTAHDLLGRVRYVMAAEDAVEMRRRYEETGPFKPSED